MSRFGETGTENYGYGPKLTSDAMGIKGESSNVLEWTTDAQEMVEKLFAGTESDGKGKYAEHCEDLKGEIKGHGPECSPIPEVGQSDLTECFYVNTLDCIEGWRTGVFDSTRRFIDIYIQNSELRRDYDSGFPRYGNDEGGSYYGKTQSLEPEREVYDDIKDQFEACLEDIVNICECKHCQSGTLGEDDEDDDDGGDDDEDDDIDVPGLTPNYEDLETSSSFNIIPRVWGRYVVGGNIIWIGNQRNILSSVTYELPTGRKTAETYNNYIDMLVGLCVGEMDGIVRVWLGDYLLYNDLLFLEAIGESTDDFSSAAAANNSFDLSALEADKPIIRFFRGSAAQHVYSAAAEENGFGRVPAYRNLCYLRLDNINLNYFDGKFPDLRIEVASLLENDYRYLESDNAYTIDEERLAVEPRTGQMFVTEGGDVTVFDWDTMEERWGVPYAPSTDHFVALESGYPLHFLPFATHYEEARVYDQTFVSRIIDNDENPTGDKVGISAHSGKPLFVATRRFSVEDAKGYDRVYYTTEADYVKYIDYDYTDETLTPNDDFEYPRQYVGTGDVVENAMYHSADGSYYIQFRVDAASATALDICKFKVAGDDGSFLSELTGAEFSLTSVPSTDIWGADTTGIKIIQAVNVASDNTILLFIRQETSGVYRLTKIDPSDMSVVWNSTIPYAIDTWGKFGNPVASRSASNTLYFLTVSGVVLYVDLSDGVVYEEGSLSYFGWPSYASGGAQYYDGRTRSLTYVTTANTIARIFFNRVNPLRIPLNTIIDDIAGASPLTADIVDGRALSAVTVAGYAITESTSVSKFLTEVIDFYQLAVFDDGSEIVLAPKSDLPSVVSLDPSMDIIADTINRGSLNQGALPDSIRVAFVTIDSTGLVQQVQELSVRGEDEEDVYQATKVSEYDLRVNEDPAIMRLYAEQALIASRSEKTTMGAALMPRKIGVTTQDQVSLYGVTYRVTGTFLSPDNMTEITAAKFSVDDFATQVSISSATVHNAVATNRVIRSGVYRPVALFTNALSNDAALRSTSGRQIAYVAVEAGTADIPSTRVQVRVQEHQGVVPDRLDAEYAYYYYTVPSSNLYTSASINKAAHFGVTLNSPHGHSERQTPWTSNEDDYVVVQFARDDTIDYIQTLNSYDYPSYEVLETETENLLIIGREYIKFGKYTVGANREVLFENLIRGYLGTSSYMAHEDGERAYLYSADTIKEISLESHYTKRGARAKVFVAQTAPAGTLPQYFYPEADAGSARPWPPVLAEVVAIDGDESRLTVRVNRQHPLFFDVLGVGGDIADIWGSDEYYIKEVSSSDFTWDDDQYAVNLAGWQLLTLEDDGGPFLDFEVEMASQHTRAYVLVSHVARDGKGEPVTGHPLRIRIAGGLTDTYNTA